MTETEAERAPLAGYVGFVSRGVALLVDALCVYVAALMAGGALKLLLSLVGASSHLSTDVIIAGGFVATFVWGAAYFIFFWTVTGQTPGARLMGFRVLTRGPLAKPGFVCAVRRVVGLYLCVLSVGIGFLPVLVDEERRGWHDRLAGTVVRWAPPDWVLQRALQRTRHAELAARAQTAETEVARSGAAGSEDAGAVGGETEVAGTDTAEGPRFSEPT